MPRMPDVFQKIDETIQQAKQELQNLVGGDALEAFRIKYLGAKGVVKDMMGQLAAVPRELKPQVGQKLNALKQQIQAAFDERKASLGGGAPTGPRTDVTEPGARPAIGNYHVLVKTTSELTELFGRMGFAVASGPEVEDEFHNFIALNIPRSHPARDPLDNFYLAPADATEHTTEEGKQILLRTQTSTVQIRVMQSQKPPIRVVIPGRVYRPDTHDATHLSMFTQLEALVVDKNVTMVDLKSTVMQFIHAYFGPDTRARFRPSFFPFTEPSAEVDVWFEDKQRWIELGGCGMVHPNVLRSGGIDPEVYSGWAFGFGIERIAMRKYAIDDIRLFVENDVRFLRQF
jgi:phenylalanyl-tRNA synthetase alpha chain